ncbi:hypothetical protein [Glycocaulis sp.]|uniref:hypothetical protein n=1 Tax=Glycocaulis sp. TaxID=1969725 RepID=UPI003D2299FE
MDYENPFSIKKLMKKIYYYLNSFLNWKIFQYFKKNFSWTLFVSIVTAATAIFGVVSWRLEQPIRTNTLEALRLTILESQIDDLEQFRGRGVDAGARLNRLYEVGYTVNHISLERIRASSFSISESNFNRTNGLNISNSDLSNFSAHSHDLTNLQTIDYNFHINNDFRTEANSVSNLTECRLNDVIIHIGSMSRLELHRCHLNKVIIAMPPASTVGFTASYLVNSIIVAVENQEDFIYINENSSEQHQNLLRDVFFSSTFVDSSTFEWSPHFSSYTLFSAMDTGCAASCISGVHNTYYSSVLNDESYAHRLDRAFEYVFRFSYVDSYFTSSNVWFELEYGLTFINVVKRSIDCSSYYYWLNSIFEDHADARFLDDSCNSRSQEALRSVFLRCGNEARIICSESEFYRLLRTSVP